MSAKIKKLFDFLSGLPMTIVGGIALLLSFILPRINNFAWQNLIHYHYYYNGREIHGGHVVPQLAEQNGEKARPRANLQHTDGGCIPIRELPLDVRLGEVIALGQCALAVAHAVALQI